MSELFHFETVGFVDLEHTMLTARRNLVAHRGPLQSLLVEAAQAAQEAGVVIQLSTRIVSIDETGLSSAATTKEQRRIEADLIIGADGKLPSLSFPRTNSI